MHALCKICGYHCASARCGVVDLQELPVGEGLGSNAGDGGIQGWCGVAERQQDGDAGHGHDPKRVKVDLHACRSLRPSNTCLTMRTKLTLSVPMDFKRTARRLSQRRGKSISALVVELIEREAAMQGDPFANLRGIWKDRDIDAEELRERAWKRS